MIRRIRSIAEPRTLLLGALFALLYPLGMPGYDVPAVPFLAFVPFLFLSVSAPSPRDAARLGFLAGAAANIPLYYWISWTVAVPGNLGWIAGAAASLAVSSFLAVYISAAAWAAHRLERRFGPNGLYAFPAVWTGLELLRSVLFTGFPWMLYGYSVAESDMFRQIADLSGVFGIGFLLLLVNVAFWRVLTLASAREFRKALPHAAAIPLVILAWGGYGAARLSVPQVPGASLPVGIAQGGIDQNLKWDIKFQDETIRIYKDLTADLAKNKPAVIVWPETAAPFFYGWEAELTRQVETIGREAGVPLIFGAPWFDPGEGGKYFNSVFQLDALGVPAGRYDKRRLVPFGEYVPLKFLLGFVMNKLTAGAEDFSMGTSPSLFSLGGTKAAASICYEAVFPWVVRESVKAGGSFLVNVTNDSWFGDTVAPRQHLAMARMRCVEFRRPMVRAANAGISAVIDRDGRITASLGFGRRGVVRGVIAPSSKASPYAVSGEIFPALCGIFSFLILGIPRSRE